MRKYFLALRHTGKPSESLKYALRAVHLTPNDDPEVLMNLAEAFANVGKWNEAAQAAEKALAVAQQPQVNTNIRIRLDELRTRRQKSR